MLTYKRSTTIGKIKIIELTDKERLHLKEGFRRGKSHSFRIRCRAILLKSNGLISKEVGIQTEMTHVSVNSGGNGSSVKVSRAGYTSRARSEADNGQF